MRLSFIFVICLAAAEVKRKFSIGYAKFCDSMLASGGKDYAVRCRDHRPDPNFKPPRRKATERKVVSNVREPTSEDNIMRRKGIIIVSDEAAKILQTPVVASAPKQTPKTREKEIKIVIPAGTLPSCKNIKEQISGPLNPAGTETEDKIMRKQGKIKVSEGAAEIIKASAKSTVATSGYSAEKKVKIVVPGKKNISRTEGNFESVTPKPSMAPRHTGKPPAVSTSSETISIPNSNSNAYSPDNTATKNLGFSPSTNAAARNVAANSTQNSSMPQISQNSNATNPQHVKTSNPVQSPTASFSTGGKSSGFEISLSFTRV